MNEKEFIHLLTSFKITNKFDGSELSEVFHAFDADSDGLVSENEFVTWIGERIFFFSFFFPFHHLLYLVAECVHTQRTLVYFILPVYVFSNSDIPFDFSPLPHIHISSWNDVGNRAENEHEEEG